MAINVTKPAINLREKLNEVTLETGIKGEELLNSDTSAEARNVLELDTHLFTDFESTGIDDNATSTAITIDASENVGIGTTSTGSSRLSISGTGTGTNPTLAIDNSTTSTFIHSQENMAVNMTAGQTNTLFVGQASSTKNAGYIGYRFSAAGSNANVLSLGHWGSDHLLNVDGLGRVGIGITNPDARFVISTDNENPFISGTGVRQGAIAISSKNGSDVYGMYLGVDNSGSGWISAGRTNTGTYYNLKLNANGGNVVLGGNLKVDSGYGIDFSASADTTTGTVTSQVLDDYEEGTWTPTTGGTTCTVNKATYTKIGRIVHVAAYLTGFSGSTGSTIGGLPFAAGPLNYNAARYHTSNANAYLFVLRTGNTSTSMSFLNYADAPVAITAAATTFIVFNATYET